MYEFEIPVSTFSLQFQQIPVNWPQRNHIAPHPPVGRHNPAVITTINLITASNNPGPALRTHLTDIFHHIFLPDKLYPIQLLPSQPPPFLLLTPQLCAENTQNNSNQIHREAMFCVKITISLPNTFLKELKQKKISLFKNRNSTIR